MEKLQFSLAPDGDPDSTEIDEEDYPEVRAQAVFPPRWVQWVEEGKKEDPAKIKALVWGVDKFWVDTTNLTIEWVDEGTWFTIHQVDGHEFISYDVYQA